MSVSAQASTLFANLASPMALLTRFSQDMAGPKTNGSNAINDPIIPLMCIRPSIAPQIQSGGDESVNTILPQGSLPMKITSQPSWHYLLSYSCRRFISNMLENYRIAFTLTAVAATSN